MDKKERKKRLIQRLGELKNNPKCLPNVNYMKISFNLERNKPVVSNIPCRLFSCVCVCGRICSRLFVCLFVCVCLIYI